MGQKSHIRGGSARTRIDVMEEQIEKALQVLKEGGLILYPTDTVWGIGCDATNAQAVEKIYALKRRTDKLSMIVLVDSPDNLVRYVRQVPEVAWELIEVGDKPLTLIMPEGVGVSENLLPPEKSIAIRIPNHKFCQALLRKLRRPLVSTSANISGEATPMRYTDISQEIVSGVDFVVDPSCEGEPTCKPSSIIKLGLGGEFTIIRS